MIEGECWSKQSVGKQLRLRSSHEYACPVLRDPVPHNSRVLYCLFMPQPYCTPVSRTRAIAGTTPGLCCSIIYK